MSLERTKVNMATTSLVLFHTACLLYSKFCYGRSVPSGQENGLDTSGPLLLLDYRFKESSDLAALLISSMMDFRVELGVLVYDIVYDETAPEREERKQPCFRRLFDLPWYRRVKTLLVAHLEDVLNKLMKKDGELAEMISNCVSSDKKCIDRVKIQAVKEIDAFGKSELPKEIKIRNMHIRRIKSEMERCLNNTETNK